MEEFLLAQSITLYPASVRPRSDSLANSSFPFFNSKLLSTLGDNDGNNASPQSTTVPLPDSQKTILRPAVSSPDIKALFNGPQGHHAYNHIPSDSNNSATANPTTHAPSYHYQPAYQASTQMSGLPELHTPRFHTTQGSSSGSGHTPSYSISSSFIPSHPTRLSEEMVLPSSTSNKRDSDPVMEAKIKDMIRRGALGHHLNARAQSLDISRQTKTFGRHASPSADSEAVSAALSQLRL